MALWLQQYTLLDPPSSGPAGLVYSHLGQSLISGYICKWNRESDSLSWSDSTDSAMLTAFAK